MASMLERLTEALSEVRNLRLALEKETEERRRDHDTIIEHRERIVTIFKRVETLEETDRQWAQEQKNDLKGEIKEDKTDHKDGSKEKRTNWALFWITLSSAIGGAVATVFLMKAMGLH